MKYNADYNPDVLSCLANLSSDEVFTSPKLANEILDLLPSSLWSDKHATFLDPCCKSGVFLREIAKRLIRGLEIEFPDLEERLNHIYTNQLFGIGITELTSLLSRRSLYCSKNADSIYSISSKFINNQGNIFFKNTKHTWVNEGCIYCGANMNEYERDSSMESYAYQFIHNDLPDKIKSMKFDVIIGNPPYQLNVGEIQESYAIPIYHKFVLNAKKLMPKYLTMIIPSRWFVGGRGLDEFRNDMLKDSRIKEIHDFLDASDCFRGVQIKGGVCYFLWDRDYKGNCKVTTYENGAPISTLTRPMLEEGMDVFIRYNNSIPILNKIRSKNEESFSKIVSPQTPFGLYSSFRDYKKTYNKGDIKIYANREIGYLPNSFEIKKNPHLIYTWKLFVPKAIGSGDSKTDWIKPLIGEPGSICTQTYLVIGPFNSKEEAENAYKYTQTKFFHFLLTLLKNTQDTMSKVYSLIPLQDFNKVWDDEMLYNKYSLNEGDRDFINLLIPNRE